MLGDGLPKKTRIKWENGDKPLADTGRTRIAPFSENFGLKMLGVQHRFLGFSELRAAESVERPEVGHAGHRPPATLWLCQNSY